MIPHPPSSPLLPDTTLFRSGAAEPASPQHIAGVTERLAAHVLGVPGYEESRVIYGGSAKPGLLPKVGSAVGGLLDRKSTRLDSSHANISYDVFCLKKNKNLT